MLSLVWKTGTRSLIHFLECAFGFKRVKTHTGFSAHAECAKYPATFTYYTIVREPLERFFSS